MMQANPTPVVLDPSHSAIDTPITRPTQVLSAIKVLSGSSHFGSLGSQSHLEPACGSMAASAALVVRPLADATAGEVPRRCREAAMARCSLSRAGSPRTR